MCVERLFPEGPAPARYAPTVYEFLRRGTSAAAAAIRDLIESWFTSWPEGDEREREKKRDVARRLQSKDPAGFPGAFWELYLYEAHRCLGFKITSDPPLPDTRKTPDYLMERDGQGFYLEATIVDHPRHVLAQRRAEEHLVSLVGEAYHPDFSVVVTGVHAAKQQPRKREVVAAVEAWLATLEWQEDAAAVPSLDSHPHHIEVAGSHVFLRPYPRPEPVRGKPTFPTVVMRTGLGGTTFEPPSILDDLKDKAGKYPIERPYVIALSVLRELAMERDVEQALFGSEQVVTPVGPPGASDEAYLARAPDGLWHTGAEPRFTRVSAVLSAIQLQPWTVGLTRPALWRNPWAAEPMFVDLPWARVDVDVGSNELMRSDAAVEPATLFGLPEGWPGPLY